MIGLLGTQLSVKLKRKNLFIIKFHLELQERYNGLLKIYV